MVADLELGTDLADGAKMPKVSEYYLWEDQPGVIFYFVGFPILTVVDEFGEIVREFEDYNFFKLCMVGDDRVWYAEADDPGLVPYDSEKHEICSCGQLGCAWGE